MKNKVWITSVFILSAISLFISVQLFYNLGIYVDEYGTSPNIVNGGDFWLVMDWLRLLLLFILTIVSGIKLLYKKKVI